ncbi:TlpA family protein disulfide reductase [Parabacteroides pacaensis]|uniref:TlpA family protein disulfide reductase n=1 Tax=Parabacteroides pacaensis TaxID=2086575 RepID=UPI000D106108|nr:TlpA disulfide reductase family protein [Parabacteroides pacaensis]
MKQIILVTIFLFCSLNMIKAKEKTVEHPPFISKNTTTLEINKIVMSDTATVFFIDAFFHPHYWIRIDEATYLKAGDMKIPIKYGDGIELNKEFWMPDSGEASFKLIFPPLPKGTKEVDFIESDCETCFKIWGIRIDGKPLQTLSIDKKWTNTLLDYSAPLEIPKIEKGTAILSGELLEYRPGMEFTGKLYYDNIISSENTEIDFTVNNDGTFLVKVPMVSAAKVYLSSPFFKGYIVLVPNKETRILFNLRELSRNDSKLRKEEKSYGKRIYAQGAYAALNEELINNPVEISLSGTSQEEYNSILKEINGMTPAQYKDYWMKRYQKAIDEVKNTKGIGNSYQTTRGMSDNYKKLICLELELDCIDQLTSADHLLRKAYKKANNIDDDSPASNFELADFPVDYYEVLKIFDLNNPLMLLCNNYIYTPQSLKYANLKNEKQNPDGLFEYLINSGKLKEEESELLKELIVSQKEGAKFEKKEELMKIRISYDALAQEYGQSQIKKHNNKNILAQILGSDKGLLFELMEIQPMADQLSDFEPLTKEQIEIAEQLSPIYKEVLVAMNDDILKKIEENKKKTGYRVHEVPQVANEELFDTIISPYKGKVVFVDFWATWCGPCRQAMKEAEPVKEALLGKDIVYLYLTGETSPLGAWKNMIPDIHGEHYRLSDTQWNYINGKFNIRGIPAYLIIDKNGKQSHFQISFMGAEKMKEMLLKELEKK